MYTRRPSFPNPPFLTFRRLEEQAENYTDNVPTYCLDNFEIVDQYGNLQAQIANRKNKDHREEGEGSHLQSKRMAMKQEQVSY